jgi:hypothetical protein
VNATNGSARLPTLSAAMPTATEMTMTCSTLKPTVEVIAPVVARRARHGEAEEVLRDQALEEVPPRADRVGAPVVSWSCATRLPGWIVMPRTMPIVTAMRAVIPNHSRV